MLTRIHLPRRTRRGQRGVTLFVAMIMLLIFGVIAATAFNGTLTSVQAVGNMQWRNEAINAANDAIDRVLSSGEFATNTTLYAENLNKAPLTVDIDGDQNPDLQVRFVQPPISGAAGDRPYCTRARSIPTKELDADNPQDRGCFGSSAGEASGLGTVETTGGGTSSLVVPDSICSNTEWAVTMIAEEAAADAARVTQANVTITQGVGVRVFRGDALTYCK